jgi:plastocyanin
MKTTTRNIGLLLCAAIFGSLGAQAASTYHVVNQNKLQFSVSEIRIKKGDTVRFMNSDRTAHNILVKEGTTVLNSGLQQPGEPFDVPFNSAGEFPVSCGIHPKMHMTVIVE